MQGYLGISLKLEVHARISDAPPGLCSHVATSTTSSYLGRLSTKACSSFAFAWHQQFLNPVMNMNLSLLHLLEGRGWICDVRRLARG